MGVIQHYPIIFLREGAKVAESVVKIRYPWFDKDGDLISNSLRHGTAFIIGSLRRSGKAVLSTDD